MNLIPIPEGLNREINSTVLTCLSGHSAHSDVTEALMIAIAPLGDAKTFCPDSSNYQYLAVYANDTIFAYAINLQTVAFRLSPTFKHRAIKTGGETLENLENGWVAFDIFRSDWPEVDIEFWARKAYLFALELDDS